MPKVSIIMPVYNCAQTVGSAIESIISQTYTDWEFIICDDCSKDNTYEIIEQYSRSDGRIVAIRNDINQGCGITCNNCIANSAGEYIARMDGDDISLPNRLIEQIQFLDEHPEFAFVGASANVFNKDGRYATISYPQMPQIKDFRLGAFFVHPVIMIRRSILDKVGLYKGRDEVYRAEDYEFFARIYSAGYKGYNLQSVLFDYRVEDADYRKRTFRTRLGMVSVKYKVFHLLNFHWYEYIYLIKPLIMGLIPAFLQRAIFKRRFMFKTHCDNRGRLV